MQSLGKIRFIIIQHTSPNDNQALVQKKIEHIQGEQLQVINIHNKQNQVINKLQHYILKTRLRYVYI